MESNYITAFVGLAGVAIGGVTSFATTWLTQRNAIRDRHFQSERTKLETLFCEFIAEATRLYGDALSHEKQDVADLVALYALLGRIRLVAADPVVRAAETTLTTIIDAYCAPNRSLADLRVLAQSGGLNFLLDFGDACRRELATMTVPA